MWSLQLNFFKIFVVDLLHEIELGLWKLIFIHLIRILLACAQEATSKLNERFADFQENRALFWSEPLNRYRLISTFGVDTIRKFTSDASSLKKMAARDYEDLLLCSMPVFEGLFPGDHDSIVQELLFSLLLWHGLAKMRIHTDKTLVLLQDAKHHLGAALQQFQDLTCMAYETRELPSECQRRERREARRMANLNKGEGSRLQESQAPNIGIKDTCSPTVTENLNQRKGTKATSQTKEKPKENRESKRKRFNLNTYKAHALDHYLDDIIEFGTVDSYSTQIVRAYSFLVQHFYA